MMRTTSSNPLSSIYSSEGPFPEPSNVDRLIQRITMGLREAWEEKDREGMDAFLLEVEKWVEERVRPKDSPIFSSSSADLLATAEASTERSYSKFWTPLKLREAFHLMDSKYCITKRRMIPPSPHEVRRTLNLAQILVSCDKKIQLITFDGDETLYPNGANFQDPELAELITQLLAQKIQIALVTAAGYGTDPTMYEQRLQLLLDTFKTSRNLSAEHFQCFWVFGGEANYLFQLREDCHLQSVPYSDWLEYSPIVFTKERDLQQATHLLDTAEQTLRSTIEDLNLRAKIIRKERAVGMVPGGRHGLERVPEGSGAKSIRPEILQEAVARVDDALQVPEYTIPFCAFNGGADVWVDVGNKAVALQVLQTMLHITPTHCLHFGDQFTEYGNDIKVRSRSPCIWVISSDETKAVLRRILRILLSE